MDRSLAVARGSVEIKLWGNDLSRLLGNLRGRPFSWREVAKSVVNSPTATISGTLRKIVGGDFSYLQVEDTKGKIEKLWWMEYFEISEILLTDPNGLLNKPITVKYTEREVFNSMVGDYVKIKIIRRIE